MSVAVAPISRSLAVAGPRETSLPRIAYLTTEYPKVSHTFIRREIEELERRGYQVARISIRRCTDALVDAADIKEDGKTLYCLNRPFWELLWATIIQLGAHPIRWWRALAATLSMHRRSDRGMVAHAAYLMEACMLAGWLRRNHVQHVHVHFGTNSAAVARLIRLLGGPTYSVAVHGPNEFDAPLGLSLAEKLMEAEFIIAISDFCAGQIRRWLPHEHWRKIHIVRCTVGPQFLGNNSPITDTSRALLCIGRLSAQKGQHLLIDAMQLLRDRGVTARMILAGDGEMRAELEDHIARCSLQQQITITGWVNEKQVRDHLLNSRALVQPSFAEGLPVVIMEALAMGRPVISTMVAGIPELVRHGDNGWLITAGNVEELADAMADALAAPAERLNRMGFNGRERVRQMHYTPTEVDRLEELFRHHVAVASGARQHDALTALSPATSR